MPKLINGESRQTEAAIRNFPNLPDPALVPINVGEALLSISRETIYRLIKSGDLEAVRIGGRRMLRVGSLRQALAGGAA